MAGREGQGGKGRAGQGMAGRVGKGRAGQGRADIWGRASPGSTITSLQKKPSGRVILNVLIPASGSKTHGVYTTRVC